MVKLLQKINIGISVAVLTVCAIALLLFGWSATGWKAMAIPTGSMRPDIPPGSLVLTHRVPVSSLKVGDVVTHTDPFNPKISITHRIIKISRLGGKVPVFVTKGDANKIADVPVTGSEVIGKVVWHIPDVGWALLKAKNPWFILPFVYVAALLIMIEEIIRLRDYLRLCIPYRAPGYNDVQDSVGIVTKRISQGFALTVAIVATSVVFGPSVLAALHTNTVSLVKNTISVVPNSKNTNTCTASNSTTQNGQSGNVTNAGNSGSTGNTSSGSVSNNNTTTITVNQGC